MSSPVASRSANSSPRSSVRFSPFMRRKGLSLIRFRFSDRSRYSS
jgi:hypothetical protein